MWSLAITRGGTEFSVRDELCLAGLETFLPYTVEKLITTRGRISKATWTAVPRWPRYLFVNTSALPKTRLAAALVRSSDGNPAQLTQRAMDTLKADCDAQGRVIRPHSFSVGDLLRFVDRSSLVTSVRDNGDLDLLVDGHIKVTAHYSELAHA